MWLNLISGSFTANLVRVCGLVECLFNHMFLNISMDVYYFWLQGSNGLKKRELENGIWGQFYRVIPECTIFGTIAVSATFVEMLVLPIRKDSVAKLPERVSWKIRKSNDRMGPSGINIYLTLIAVLGAW